MEFRRPCPNDRCIEGWDCAPHRMPRCCTACDGRGYMGSASANRRYYYDMRALMVDLEITSKGYGFEPQTTLDTIDLVAALA